MKLKNFALIWVFLTLILSHNIKVFAGEPLVKYESFFLTDPATGLRLNDGSQTASFGIEDQHKFKDYPIASVLENQNKPLIGYPDDCYPDDPGRPEGNIVISGRIISNFTNRPVSGAVVAVYMGAEQTGNIGDNDVIHFNDRFVHGGKDDLGRLTNLYYYDISKDGYYRVFACNAYKTLSERRKDELKKFSPNLFANPRKPCDLDGYSGNTTECTNYDYVRAFPKFSLAVICGLQNTRDRDNPSPILGEIYSIDNYNDDYKSANPPAFMSKKNFDIRVNCGDNLAPFPLPNNLIYDSSTNIASCRTDDISPNLQNYFTKVQLPLKNDFRTLEAMTLPGSTLIPNDTALPDCTNPDDIFCLKNFITKSFPKPVKGVNIFDYGNKTVLDPVNSNPLTRDNTLSYRTGFAFPQVDLSDEETPGRNDWIPFERGSSEGQLDAKIDMKSFISDYKFDLNTLKDLYACFTTFNAPPNKSNADVDEVNRAKFANRTAVQNEFYANNLRVPTCKELYCGTEFVPDDKVCKISNPRLAEREKFGKEFNVNSPYDQFTQLNALTGYGPGVTLNFKNLEEITNDLLVLSKDLINSDFNPKKSMPAGVPVLYKPVTKVSDIVACLDDNNNPVYLNEGIGGKKEGSITYSVNGTDTTFFSPVPLMSYISVPYTMELFHSIEGDNYQNMLTSQPSTNVLFPEQCNLKSFEDAVRDPTLNKTQYFANCRKAVIPGGVYSISALRVIANICSNIVKLPTPDAGVFNRVINLSQKNQNTASSVSYINDGIDVELSVTKIGTPSSMCLCKVGDENCSISSSLNNKSTAQDFAISSIVGQANQNVKEDGKSYNGLGFTCGNFHASKTSKEPAIDCQLRISGLGEWNIPNDSGHNFIGTNNNFQIKWPFAQSDFGDADTVHQYLTYSYTGDEAPDPSKYKSYVFSSNGTISGWGEGRISGNPETGARPCKKASYTFKDSTTGERVNCEQAGYENGVYKCLVPDAITDKLECDDPRSIRPEGIGLDKVPKQISSMTNRILDFDKGDTQIPNINKLDASAGPSNDFVSPEIRVVQLTWDGTQGIANGRYRMRTAKYDPIPELLNEFRKYSIYGAVPGNGGEYCRTPKLGSSLDIDTYRFNIRNSYSSPLSNDTYTAGRHCNVEIPEELERCNDSANWPQTWINGWNKRGLSTADRIKECRLAKCYQLCDDNSSISFYPVQLYIKNNPVDPSRSDFFCRNYGATKGMEFQVNSGDEGCVVDYSGKMKQNYANPAEVSYDYVSAFTQSKFSKENYPVFNNRICLNPSNTDPITGGTLDKGKCLPYLKDTLKGVEQYNDKGTIVPNN